MVVLKILWMLLYLILFLYQTTTCFFIHYSLLCCILFCSYIKPQRLSEKLQKQWVVSYSVPISNHNAPSWTQPRIVLYLILFLYQTTTQDHSTEPLRCCILFCSYIKPQRASVRAVSFSCCILFCSYIKPQLVNSLPDIVNSCILFCSYIKPQLRRMD